MTAVDDRRQAAREAGQDTASVSAVAVNAIDAAIETATRVQITSEIIAAAKPTVPWLTEKERLARAFRAAGFEVEE